MTTWKYDMLISNPPYIRTEDIEGLMEEVRFHDPVLALDGKENGLYFYEKITEQAGTYHETRRMADVRESVVIRYGCVGNYEKNRF